MTAIVHAFPAVKRGETLESIANLMAKQSSIEKADDELYGFLEWYWEKLEQLGVADDEIESDCRLFANAAWDRFRQLWRDAGVA